MKMFVFYFTAFMFDMNNGAYIPVKNSFVYKTEEILKGLASQEDI